MSDGVCFEKENVVANDTKSATTWRRVRDLNPGTGVAGLRDFECCLSLADTRLEQIVTGSLVKCRKPRRRKGLRTF